MGFPLPFQAPLINPYSAYEVFVLLVHLSTGWATGFELLFPIFPDSALVPEEGQIAGCTSLKKVDIWGIKGCWPKTSSVVICMTSGEVVCRCGSAGSVLFRGPGGILSPDRESLAGWFAFPRRNQLE